MKPRPVRPAIKQIQGRFFRALNELISQKKIEGLATFCKNYDLNVSKYCELRGVASGSKKSSRYRFIDLDAPAYLIKDFKVSGEWLFTGKGSMFIS